MPNCLPSSSEMSITASLRVCMCTVGVSLYSSTASHPLSLFNSYLPYGSLYNLLCFDQRTVAVNLIEEQADCRRHRPGARAVDHVERVTRAWQLDVAHHRMRRRAQPLDEAARLLDRDHAVASAVDDQERRRAGVHSRDG